MEVATDLFIHIVKYIYKYNGLLEKRVGFGFIFIGCWLDVEMWAWLSVVKNVCVLAGPELKMTEDENDWRKHFTGRSSYDV